MEPWVVVLICLMVVVFPEATEANFANREFCTRKTGGPKVTSIRGCTGALKLEPAPQRSLEKCVPFIITTGWLKVRENTLRSELKFNKLSVLGNCCWKVEGRNGKTQDVSIFNENTFKPNFIKRVRTVSC